MMITYKNCKRFLREDESYSWFLILQIKYRMILI